MIEWFFFQSSQMLGVLAFAGAAAGWYRWDKAIRRDFLLAFILFLAGTGLREVPVYIWGLKDWPDLAFCISAAARLFQLAGAFLFLRYALRDICPPWAMVVFLVLVALFVMAV